MNSLTHNHQHSLNRFAVIPTDVRLNAHRQYTGKNVTIAFLDSGFCYHPDLSKPENRIIAYHDISRESASLDLEKAGVSWQWHGTQTSVAAAGNGYLSDGVYRGLASESKLALVKVSDNAGRISEENIERGLQWILENRERYNIRVLNVSLAGDEDVPCSRSLIDQLAEEAVRGGIAVVAAAGNSNERHSIPPANSPSVITVGGYSDNNRLSGEIDLYHSNFGYTADGTLKPEVVAPAMWIAAPILPDTVDYHHAEALSRLLAAPDFELPKLFRTLQPVTQLPPGLAVQDVAMIREVVEAVLLRHKIVSTHYQHVDGTSFAAPIVSSVVAQMIQANPRITPATIKNILVMTADRIEGASALRQGYGIVNARRAVEAAREERHELPANGCRATHIEGDEITFIHHDDEAQTVSVAGEFNKWDYSKTPMKRDGTGIWRTTIAKLTPGRYQYKFVVNGYRWVEDATSGRKVLDSYGGFNSLLVVE